MASPKESIGQHKTRMPKPIVLVSALLALFALIAAGRYASTFIKNQRLAAGRHHQKCCMSEPSNFDSVQIHELSFL